MIATNPELAKEIAANVAKKLRVERVVYTTPKRSDDLANKIFKDHERLALKHHAKRSATAGKALDEMLENFKSSKTIFSRVSSFVQSKIEDLTRKPFSERDVVIVQAVYVYNSIATQNEGIAPVIAQFNLDKQFQEQQLPPQLAYKKLQNEDFIFDSIIKVRNQRRSETTAKIRQIIDLEQTKLGKRITREDLKDLRNDFAVRVQRALYKL